MSSEKKSLSEDHVALFFLLVHLQAQVRAQHIAEDLMAQAVVLHQDLILLVVVFVQSRVNFQVNLRVVEGLLKNSFSAFDLTWEKTIFAPLSLYTINRLGVFQVSSVPKVWTLILCATPN